MSIGTMEKKITVPFNKDEEFVDASKRFADVVAKGHINIAVDMTGIPNLISRQVGVLVMVYKELKEREGVLTIINVSDTLYEMFSILNLNSIISITKEKG